MNKFTLATLRSILSPQWSDLFIKFCAGDRMGLTMQLNFVGELSEVKQGLELLAKKTGFALSEAGIAVNVVKGKQLSVGIDGRGGTVEYSLKSEFFRALSIFLHNLKQGETNFSYKETRKIRDCGIMIDCSRNAVLKVSTVKDIIMRMARMGLNTLMLYTEDTYKLEAHPYFGYMRGAYTKDELKDMVEFANTFGVDMIPCIQTLGHLEKPLRWKAFAEVSESRNLLMVGEPKTYEFIEEMIKHMRECHTSSKIHIGMDEAHNLGLGRYLNEHGYHDSHELMEEHINKVMEIIKKYDFEPMIWNDMYFRMNNPNPSMKNADYANPNLRYLPYLNGGELQYYNPNVNFKPGTAEMVPEDVSLVYWDYYNINPEIYRGMIKKTKKLGEKIIFAGGIWTWNGITPSYQHTMVSTRAALEACQKEGVNEMFACVWGDNGAECSIYTTLLGMQLYAEFCYCENVDDARLNAMFKACAGYDMDAFLSLDMDACIEESDMLRPSTTKQALYQDILQGLFDKNFELADLKTHYKNCGEKLRSLENQGDLEYLFEMYRQHALVVEKKCDLGIRLTRSYRENDKNAMKYLAGEIEALIPEVEKLHQMVADIWYRNNKPFNFNVLDVRFGGLCARIKRAKVRINDYLCGNISSLEELEEERLYYNGESKPFISMGNSDNIMFV